ncbi:pectinesterase inhibitor [Eucalyptus grandis]|uniref:pectinesterase inhibitor n=1 Tax=Eucalyptus grandis TaxID=71139 RepID=UPI00192E7992|nr:pectinesterase inhibitor [Eucalyptus grandis]
MATLKAHALFLLVAATSALLLSSAVDAICVSRKPQSLESASLKTLPQTPASFKRPPSGPLASLSASFKKPLSDALASLSTSKAAVAVDHMVADICHQTDYPDICISSVGAHLKGPADVLSLLTAEIEACTEKMKSAAAEVTKLAADPSASPATKMALSACDENYSSALDSLSSAQEAIAAHDAGTLNSELSAVITFVTTCDDSFAEMTMNSPLEGTGRILQKLGSNCLAIAARAHL